MPKLPIDMSKARATADRSRTGREQTEADAETSGFCAPFYLLTNERLKFWVLALVDDALEMFIALPVARFSFFGDVFPRLVACPRLDSGTSTLQKLNLLVVQPYLLTAPFEVLSNCLLLTYCNYLHNSPSPSRKGILAFLVGSDHIIPGWQPTC